VRAAPQRSVPGDRERDRRVGRVDFADEPVAVENAVGDLAGRDAVADGVDGLKVAPVNAQLGRGDRLSVGR
jgi:hypothetical protein